MNNILNCILSPADREQLFDFLDEVERKTHNLHEDAVGFAATAPLGSAPFIQEIMGEAVAARDTVAVREKIKSLIEELKSVPTMRLTLANNYDRQNYALLVSKILAQIGRKVLIELAVDPKVIGGAIIEGNGRITDATIKEYFAQKTAYGL